MRTHTQQELCVCVFLYFCVFVYVLLGKIHNDSRKNELQIYVSTSPCPSLPSSSVEFSRLGLAKS